MAIHYSVVYEVHGREISVGITDHCYGAMKNMPWNMDKISYDFCDSISSPRMAIRNMFAMYQDNSNIKEVRLHDYNLSSHWNNFEEYLCFMDELKESGHLPYLTGYETNHELDYISVKVDCNEMWEEVMPKLFFIRNLMAYSELLPRFRESLPIAAAAIATLYWTPARYGSVDRAYVDTDGEYAFFDNAYFGESDFLRIYNENVAYSAGCGIDNIVLDSGYNREEDYDEEAEWDVDGNAGDDSSYHFSLSKVMLSLDDNKFPPFDNFSSGDAYVDDIVFAFKNYLTSKGMM
ncbi:hypothetical protein PQC39_gp071 [Vibrio phage Vp_R1]|uniref:Uncharacterized protein n=1 Tax=Vibrio phage Vp_R1 TaxID=2059867 RepID=A0A2H5BQ44_9CAUD|nr:hypothetical protein PQC39_gp071 [Vibrio phage Vp_R1]AUG88435.1 hypothetical protein VPR_071 [Vibrio phage Vp_R1]